MPGARAIGGEHYRLVASCVLACFLSLQESSILARTTGPSNKTIDACRRDTMEPGRVSYYALHIETCIYQA